MPSIVSMLLLVFMGILGLLLLLYSYDNGVICDDYGITTFDYIVDILLVILIYCSYLTLYSYCVVYAIILFLNCIYTFLTTPNSFSFNDANIFFKDNDCFNDGLFYNFYIALWNNCNILLI